MKTKKKSLAAKPKKKSRSNFYGNKIKEYTDPNAGSNHLYSVR